jgi:hypothetical protein
VAIAVGAPDRCHTQSRELPRFKTPMAESNPIHLPEGMPEEAVDALYGLPLDEFTPRRDELAKELRSAGQRDEAEWVKGLRKPSAAAWLVNQLARTQKKDAGRVLDSGEALRSAQDQALAGEGSREEMARAAEEHADAMRALVAKAPGLLDREGGSPSEATLERAAETLRAIALDEEVRAGFASGRLTRERRAAGLGFGLVPSERAGPAEAQPKRGRGPRGKQKEREREAVVEQKARARAAVNEARSRHRDQGKEVAELERELRRAEREAESAQRRVEKAAGALDRAREKQAETQARLEEAEAAAKRL